jgi:hypothetical protein
MLIYNVIKHELATHGGRNFAKKERQDGQKAGRQTEAETDAVLDAKQDADKSARGGVERGGRRLRRGHSTRRRCQQEGLGRQ